MNHQVFEKTGIARLAVALGLAAMCLPGPAAAEEVKRVPPDDAMRAVVSKTNPTYPAIAKQMRLSGDVSLDVTVSEDGLVTDVVVLQGNPVLAKPAADAVKAWKFTPFKFDGKPTRVITTIVVKFAL